MWKRRLLRLTKWIFGALLLLALAAVALGWLIHEDRPPTGDEGADADALARAVEVATGQAAWAELGAIRWTFRGKLRHLWDRRRGYARVRWDDFEVLLRTDDRTGIARRGAHRLEGEEAAEALDYAHTRFINDSYWLNPFGKFFDEGVTRSIRDDGSLLIEFASGGRTPGDAYLIDVDAANRPRSWRMWVSILPVGGVECSWGRWVDIGRGAMASSLHDFGPVDLELSDLEGASTLAELAGGEDPFGDLL